MGQKHADVYLNSELVTGKKPFVLAGLPFLQTSIAQEKQTKQKYTASFCH